MTEGYILMDPKEFEKYFKEIKPMLKKQIRKGLELIEERTE